MGSSVDHIDTCVVGAGAIGLAVGRVLAMNGVEVVVVDREHHFGQGISSRNSEVIHAGIYYPKDSNKARLCVAGRHRLYDYASTHQVGYARCGKLIVATNADEEAELAAINERARANGVDDLEFWSKSQLKSAEPNVSAIAALFSPSTGIISAHDLMQSLLGDMTNHGGTFTGGTNIHAVSRVDEGFLISADIEGEIYEFIARRLVNSAGLGAQALATRCDFIDPEAVPPLYYCKGNYFTFPGRSPFSRLIYPVPEKSGAGLGVHATIDLGGQAKFGPDVEYTEGEDYAVSMDRLPFYYEAVRKYFPALPDGALEPGYAGIRPKLQGPNDAPADFVVEGPSAHGIEGYVQLFGIESPGLTSCMAIAEDVFRQVFEDLTL